MSQQKNFKLFNVKYDFFCGGSVEASPYNSLFSAQSLTYPITYNCHSYIAQSQNNKLKYIFFLAFKIMDSISPFDTAEEEGEEEVGERRRKQ